MNLLKISRPRFWFYLFGPYVLGAAALLHQTPSSTDLISLIIYGLYFLLPANLLIYGVNDIFDYDTDILNAKKRGYEAVLPPSNQRETWVWILALNLPFILLAPWFLPAKAILALMLFLFFGIGYSAPPIRAKTKPFLDAFFNVLYVCPALVSFGFFGFPPVALILAGTCWCMAMHAFSAVPDIKADTTANISTVATALGKNKTIIFCLFLYLASAVLSFPTIGLLAVIFGSIYALMMIIAFTQTDTQLLKLYKYFPAINMLVGFGLTLRIIYPIFIR